MKRYLLIVPFFFLTLSIPKVLAQLRSRPIEIRFFYSKTCKICQSILQQTLPELASRHHLAIKSFDIGSPSNYEKLLQLEEALGERGNDIPIIVVGRRLLSGEKEIRTQLEPLIESFEKKGDFSTIPLKGDTFPRFKGGGGKIHAAYFYGRGCNECERVFHDLAYLQTKYPQFEVRFFNVEEKKAKLFNEALGEQYHVPITKRLTVPSLLVGEDYLLKGRLDRDRVEKLIAKYILTGTPRPWQISQRSISMAQNTITRRFESFGLFAVMGAALIDSVNPCAIAVLIFFVSYLAFAGRRGKEVLVIGVVYCSAVFLTYFSLGFGLLRILRILDIIPVLVRGLYWAMASLTAFLGFLSIYDYYLLFQRREEQMTLGLPAFLGRHIHRHIREGLKPKYLVLAAFISGFFISAEELVCTGQVYLPTLLYITTLSKYRLKAIGFLLIYNVLFILPLIFIFVFAYYGHESEKLARIFRKRLGLVKILTAGLFFTLAGGLVAILVLRI